MPSLSKPIHFMKVSPLPGTAAAQPDFVDHLSCQEKSCVKLYKDGEPNVVRTVSEVGFLGSMK